MQAVTVTYLAPTNSRGARIKATCYGGSHTEARDYATDFDRQAPEVAAALCRKLGWAGEYVGACVSADTWVYVPAKSSDRFNA